MHKSPSLKQLCFVGTRNQVENDAPEMSFKLLIAMCDGKNSIYFVVPVIP